MKRIVSCLLMLFLFLSVNAQNETDKEYELIGKLPEIVLKRVGEEFSVYLPDKHPDSRVANLENKFISYNLDNKVNGEESFFVLLKTKDATLSANFSAKGKLMSVVEKYHMVKLPQNVRKSLLAHYPGWKMLTNKYTYIQKEGRVTRKQYKVLIENANKVRRIIIDEEGNIIRGKL